MLKLFVQAQVKGVVYNDDNRVRRNSIDPISVICVMLQLLETLAVRSLLRMTLGMSQSLHLYQNIHSSQENVDHDRESSQQKDENDDHFKEDSDEESGGTQQLHYNGE